MVITQDELNIPNFIELCLEKANNSKSKNQLLQNLLTDKRVAIKFGYNRIFIQETDQKQIEQEFRNILYLNNSITNENFFCLAYTVQNDLNNFDKSSINKVNALILYSNNVELIDDVIREYAYYVSAQLNDRSKIENELRNMFNLSNYKYDFDKSYLNSKIEQHTCTTCPMQQFVELCEYINTFDDKPEIVNDILIDKLNNNLSIDDQNYLFDCLSYHNLTMDTYQSLEEKNQLIVALIHKICKKKQTEHLIEYFKEKCDYKSDNLEANGSKFKLMNNCNSCYKHSKSFHSDLDALNHQNQPESDFKFRRKLKRSMTLESVHSPNILRLFSSYRFLNSSFKKSKDTFLLNLDFNEILRRRFMTRYCNSTNIFRGLTFNNFAWKKPNDSNIECDPSIKSRVSNRRAIFNKIVGFPVSFIGAKFLPSGKAVTETEENKKTDNETEKQTAEPKKPFVFKRFNSRKDVLMFWKKIISEQIILIKMEKENRKLNIRAMFAIKNKRASNDLTSLNYIEITPCLKEVDGIWQSFLDKDSEELVEIVDLETIRQTVFKGVPQMKREKIWFWLLKQNKLRNNLANASKCDKEQIKLDTEYRDLLKENSIHQHSILLDLGRTFPTHPNFAKKFGPGQLALFNVLKAYSIMDTEVGYCQGLSFIVGILLIHVNNNEEKAFELLKFLLIDLNFREQYKPEMTMLQKHMYQFTRLLHENYNEIYTHFEKNEIGPSLYAAPWFLTLFSSQFQIGFVARVFDFLFAEGPIILFKISLAILSIHKPILVSCESFESIVNHIKATIPEMSLIESELIINKSFSYSFEKNLNKFEIEYELFNEEVLMIRSRYINEIDSPAFKVNKQTNELEMENMNLKKQLKKLTNKLQILELQMHNQEDHFYKIQRENNQLKCKVETLEIERNGVLKKVFEQEMQLQSQSKSQSSFLI